MKVTGRRGRRRNVWP